MIDDNFTVDDVRKMVDGWASSGRERRHCHICGERYLLENLEDCAGCREDTCYACGSWRNNPAGKSEYVCGACLDYSAGWWNGGKASKNSNRDST